MHTRTLVTVLVLGCFGGGLASGGEPESPRPVVAWPEGPLEVRVAFDAAVDPAVAGALTGQTIPFVEAAEPGHEGEQAAGGSIRIAAARLIDEGRTLVLATDPHPRAGTYTLTLAGV